MADGPALRMLWERDDPGAALTARFGFESGPVAVAWLAAVLTSRWGIGLAACDEIVISDHNALAWITADGQRLVAKWSAAPSRFGRLADAARATVWLHDRGIPVVAPVPAGDDPLHVVLQGDRPFLLGLLPVVEGELLDVDDPQQVRDAGVVLAALHEALARYPGRVGDGPTAGGQLVHNDFRAANVLHDGAKVTAVLDFEEVTYASRAADLAKAAVMLGTRYHDWAPTPADVRSAFIGAYCEHAPLTGAEHAELDVCVAAVLREPWWGRPAEG